MTHLTATLLAATLIAVPLQAQQDSTHRRADSLVALLRPIVSNRDRIRVVQGEGHFVVEQPGRWLDTLRRPELIQVVQVRGHSAGKGAMVGAVIGFAAGAIGGAAGAVALGNMCTLGCPSPSAADNQSAAVTGGVVGGIGGAVVGGLFGALIGAAIPHWHTRLTVRPDGRIELH